PQAGHVLVQVPDGSLRDPSRLPSRELPGLIGLVFQDPEIGFVARRVVDEVSLGGPNRPGVVTEDEALEILRRFGLHELAERDPFRLSQGQQRRLSLAALTARQPRLLLLDEPTFGLDRRGRDEVLAALETWRAQGQAQVLATHDPRLLPACQRVVALDGGRVVFDGPSGAFLAAPPFVPAAPWQAVA
ncbi:MAG: energy-coupling factor ABC transporter ATP-binding protein, partial [Candidatus Limnocylindrales bacterium]